MTQKLGDNFPEETQQEFIASQMVPGAVFRIHCHFTTPPKLKRVVLVACEPDHLFLIINTNIPQIVKYNPNRAQCQLRLLAGNCAYLDHDSWLDCSDVIQIDEHEVSQQLVGNLDGVLGGIDTKTKQQVVHLASLSNLISPIQLNAIQGALTP